MKNAFAFDHPTTRRSSNVRIFINRRAKKHSRKNIALLNVRIWQFSSLSPFFFAKIDYRVVSRIYFCALSLPFFNIEHCSQPEQSYPKRVTEEFSSEIFHRLISPPNRKLQNNSYIPMANVAIEFYALEQGNPNTFSFSFLHRQHALL